MENERRQDQAARDAYDRGKREAFLLAEVESHEKAIGRINGSIEKHAKQAQALKDSIENLRDEISAVANTLKMSQAIEADRTRQLKQANEKQISARSFWLGVAAIIATIIAAVIASHGGGF